MPASSAGRATVVVCRPVAQAGSLTAQLEAAGFDVVGFPLAEVVAPRDEGAALAASVARLSNFALVAFTSVNAVNAVRRAMGEQPWPDHVATCAVGTATASAVVAAGFPTPFVPAVATAADLGATVPIELSDRPVLAPLAELASDDLVDAIEARGFTVERVTAYRSIVPEHDDALVERVVSSDLILLTSPSIARRLVAVLSERLGEAEVPPAVAIGPRTAEAASDVGLTVSRIATPSTDGGLITAVESSCP